MPFLLQADNHHLDFTWSVKIQQERMGMSVPSLSAQEVLGLISTTGRNQFPSHHTALFVKERDKNYYHLFTSPHLKNGASFRNLPRTERINAWEKSLTYV